MSDYLRFLERYEQLMNGETVDFLLFEIEDILMNMDYYNINTLMIQKKGGEDCSVPYFCFFTCRVDEPTINNYRHKNTY